MKLSEILRTKSQTVITIEPDRPIEEALRILVEHDIGALLVFDGKLRGIITERDVLRAAAADVRRLETARVSDLMTRDVITVGPDADILHIMDVMTERRIRHLPVVAEGAVIGIISIRDVVNALRQTAESENRQLHAYITGTPL